ncbi:5'-nucleotidase [Streptomyces sp. rh34]|uniref:5'-nucleotidase n=1 Tax=Streptomyces sp. rh34 TaxID=2034272 RepID=UPI000BF0E86F|nr:5'-nucleotidase [Streptomyces sp. rh34]
MYKRMLRSALAASFVAALGLGLTGVGVMGGSGEQKAVQAAAPGDIGWGAPAAAPGDIGWAAPASAPGDIGWFAPAAPGDIGWVAPARTVA